MIKAFENHEIWFVTGAQLLYGGDAVVQVDGHSSARTLERANQLSEQNVL